MKVALYKCLSLDFDVLRDAGDLFEENDDYIRLTEIVDIDLKPLSDVNIINKEVAYIDNQIKRVQAVSEVRINELKQKKQELLALPSTEEASHVND